MNILGINTGHDSGAVLLNDKYEITAVNEERLSRIKLHIGFPYLAIQEVLDIKNLKYSDIDAIIVEGKDFTPAFDVGFDKGTTDWKKSLINKLGIERILLGTEGGLSLVRTLLRGQLKNRQQKIQEFFTEKGYKGKIEYSDHHYCHATTAYYTQDIDKGIVITLDASGEGYCSKVYKAENNKLVFQQQMLCYHSPAYYYAYVTENLGFKPMRHEGKITGLAAYGNPEKGLKIFGKLIYFDKKKMSFVNKGGYHFTAMNRLKKEFEGFSREDIAAAVQVHTENLVCQYIQAVIEKYNNNEATAVFLAGGIFANVKVNQRISQLEKVNSVYIFPNMGDGGVNFGAALGYAFENKIWQKRIPFNNVYFGRLFTNEDIEQALKNNKCVYAKSENVAKETAMFVSKNKIVARFNGAMEYGPRALGHRSIIYSATDREINDWLNKKLKRTEFMPFAPYVCDDDIADYFNLDKPYIRPFKFMTITCDVTDKCKKEAPAIVHVDGTARPQVIFREEDNTYYDILKEYKKLTGIGVLVNTSFNMHEEPIVNTPDEAIKSFFNAEMDVLAIGDFIVELEKNK